MLMSFIYFCFEGCSVLPINRILIENFKSLDYCELDVDMITLLIGENGAGKSNVLQAVEHFYKNLENTFVHQDMFDDNNRLCNFLRITIFYDVNHLAKIAQMQIKEYGESAQYYNYYLKIAKTSQNIIGGIFKVELTQFKDGTTEWNIDYSGRQMVAALFPLHSITCRDIDVNDWTILWQVIGDLIKLPLKARADTHDSIVDMITELKEYERISALDKSFKDIGLKTARFSNQNFASTLAQIFFNGKEFLRKDKSLGYYSTGTNSANYIILYIKILEELAKYKLKDPVLILDEPEINLHPKLIDRVARALIHCPECISVLIATHSPRLTKNILQSEREHRIYRLFWQNNYSHTKKMRLFDAGFGKGQKHLITDEYASAYFAQALLLVEGQSEIELFSNDYIRYLFPCLYDIDMFNVMADEKQKGIIFPLERMTGVPYLAVIDMDKCYSYDTNRKRVLINTYFKKPIGSKMMYALNIKGTSNRQNTFATYQRIQAIAKKCRFHHERTWYHCFDRNHSEFIELIQTYLLQYDIFPVSTTIEGCLINHKTEPFILAYMLEKNNKKYNKVKAIYDAAPDPHCATNILRMAFQGKSDLQVKLNSTDASKEEKENLPFITKNEKASGWITEFLSFYFCSILFLESGVKVSSYDEYYIMMEKDKSIRRHIERKFREDFNELCKILDLCKEMIVDIL